MIMKSFHVIILIIIAVLCIYRWNYDRRSLQDLIDSKSNNVSEPSSASRVENETPHKIFKLWDKEFPCFTPYEKPVPEAEVLIKSPEMNQLQNTIVMRSAEAGNLKGLIYIKVPKTASSTLSGINLRIAHRKVPSNSKLLHCACTWTHCRAAKLNLYKRSRDETFLWTMIRRPASQFISEFFHFNVGRREVNPNLEEFTKFFNSKFLGDEFDWPQINYISPRALTREDLKNKEKAYETVQEIINEYDFMGVTERLDESLVALRLILGLDAGDILYISSKVNGGYDDGSYQNKCFKIPPSILSNEIEEFMDSQKWKERFEFPTIFYDALNKSLDLTIENIGKDIFAKALKEHRHLMTLADNKCAPTAIFPCSKEGELQLTNSSRDCYWGDSGCGYPCLDELYSNYTSVV